MDLNFTEHLPSDFDDNSRVWIYQSSRLFLISEALQMEEMLNDFAANWKSHGDDVKGFAGLLFGRFIIIMADETATVISGCSTDSSVRLVKTIEQKYNVQMFNRETLAFVLKDKIELLPLNQLEYAVNNNFINADTLYFNNTVNTKKDLLQNWIIPLKNSWLVKRLPQLATS